MTNEQLLEKLAELEHLQWSHWTKHFIENAEPLKIAYWLTLANAPYSKLSESQKESDREWARKVLAILPQCEPSPQTREIQKLWKNRPYKMPHHRGEYGKAVQEWSEDFEPKLEALLADHINRRKLEKLIEDLDKIFWDFDDKLDGQTRREVDEAKSLLYSKIKKRLEKLLAKKGDPKQ